MTSFEKSSILNMSRQLIEDCPKAVLPNRRIIPKNGLEAWNRIPLSSKLPVPNAPKNTFVYSRDIFGRPIYYAQNRPFNLIDQDMKYIKFEYEQLHDPHLRNTYRRTDKFKRIRDLNHVDEREEVLCTLKQFNSYRRTLHDIYSEKIYLKLSKKYKLASDQLYFSQAQQVTLKSIEKAATVDMIIERKVQKKWFYGDAENKNKSLLEKLAKWNEIDDRVKYRKFLRRMEIKSKSAIKELHTNQLLNRLHRDRRRRRALLARKIKNNLEIAEQRLLEYRLFVDRERQAKMAREWQRKIVYSAEKDAYDRLLMEYERDQRRLNVLARNIQLKKSLNQNQKRITDIRTEMIRLRYETTTKDNVIKNVGRTIHYFLRSEKMVKQGLRRFSEAPPELIDIGILPSKTTVMADKQDIDRNGGLQKVVAPYEPPHMSKIGLEDMPSGYEKITHQDIFVACTIVYDNFITLGHPINASNLAYEVMHILGRSASGFNMELPRGEELKLAVYNLLVKRVDLAKLNINKEIRQKIDAHLAYNTQQRRISVPMNATLNVSDNESRTSRTENLAFSKAKKKSVMKPEISLRSIIRTCLETPISYEKHDTQISPELSTPNLANVFRFQKFLIQKNLVAFSVDFEYYMKLYIGKHLELKKLKVKKFKSKDNTDMDAAYKEMTDSLLKLPEHNPEYGKTVVNLATVCAVELLTTIDEEMVNLKVTR